MTDLLDDKARFESVAIHRFPDENFNHSTSGKHFLQLAQVASRRKKIF